jgi:hypothetical protein
MMFWGRFELCIDWRNIPMLKIVFGVAIATATAALCQPSQSPAIGSVIQVGKEFANPEVTAAKANRSKVITEELQTAHPPYVWSTIEAERAQGHHGYAVFGGIVGADGKFSNVTTIKKTGAPALDEMAQTIARGTTFSPAKDKSGTAIPVWTEFGYQFPGRFQHTKMGGGLEQIRCDEFVGDTRWWKSILPERPWREHKLFKELSALNWYKSNFDEKSDVNLISDWETTIDYCSAHSAILLVNAWQGKINYVRALIALVGNSG